MRDMDNSHKKSGSRRKEKEKIKKMIKSRLSERERIFLIICDLLTVAIVLVDLIVLTGLAQISNLGILTLVNLVVVGISYLSYRLRKNVGRKVVRELHEVRGIEVHGEDV